MADKQILMLKAPKSETIPVFSLNTILQIWIGQVVDQGGSMESRVIQRNVIT